MRTAVSLCVRVFIAVSFGMLKRLASRSVNGGANRFANAALHHYGANGVCAAIRSKEIGPMGRCVASPWLRWHRHRLLKRATVLIARSIPIGAGAGACPLRLARER